MAHDRGVPIQIQIYRVHKDRDGEVSSASSSSDNLPSDDDDGSSSSSDDSSDDDDDGDDLYCSLSSLSEEEGEKGSRSPSFAMNYLFFVVRPYRPTPLPSHLRSRDGNGDGSGNGNGGGRSGGEEEEDQSQSLPPLHYYKFSLTSASPAEFCC